MSRISDHEEQEALRKEASDRMLRLLNETGKPRKDGSILASPRAMRLKLALKRETSGRLRRLLGESGLGTARRSPSQETDEVFDGARRLKAKSSASGVTLEEVRERRGRVERELIDTERAYITSMKLVHSHFLHPVRENMEEWELTEQDVSEIFGNIETLLQCHENFLAILLSQKKPNSYPPASYLSHALIEFGSNDDVLTAYEEYVNNYSLSQRLLFTARTAAPKFSAWLQQELRKQVLKGAETPSADRAVEVFEVMAQRLNSVKAMKTSARIISCMFVLRVILRRCLDSKSIETIVTLFSRVFELGLPVVAMDLPIDAMYLLADGPMLTVQPGEIALLLVHVFLFSDMIVCTKKREDEYHLLWGCPLINCTVIQKGSRFVIKEERACDTYPFVCAVTHELVAMSENTSYWTESMSNALSSSWEEDDYSSTVSASSIATAESKYSVLEKNMLSAADWDLLHAAGEQHTFAPDEEICWKGMPNHSLWVIVRGSVRVEIPIAGRTGVMRKVTVGTMGRGDFFGEMSLLSESHEASADIVAEGATLEEQVFSGEACPNETVIVRIGSGSLHTIMITNQHLALRFYTLVATKLALRFLKDPLKSAASKMTISAPEGRKRGLSMSAKMRIKAKRNLLTKTGSMERIAERDRFSSGMGNAESTDASQESDGGDDRGDKKVLKALADGDRTERVSQCIACSWGLVSGKFYVLRTRFGFIGSILTKKVVARFNAKEVYAVVLPDRKDSEAFRVMVDRKRYQEFIPKSKLERDKIFALLCGMVGCESDLALESMRSLEDEYSTSLQQRMLRRSNAVHLVPEDWVLLSSATATHVCHPGKVILEQGHARNRGMYQVVKGHCVVEKTNAESGEQYQVGMIDTLGVFGTIGFVLGVPATASVIAGADGATVMEFSFDKLRELFERSPDVGAGFYQFLAGSISDLFLKVEVCSSCGRSLPHITPNSEPRSGAN